MTKPFILNVRIDKETLKGIKLIARESGASVSDVVREALLLYLKEDDNGVFEIDHSNKGRASGLLQ